MKDHKAEPFGLMGGVRCAACDETWPCEVSFLRAQLEAAAKESERMRAALKPFADLDFRDSGRDGYVNPPVYTADIRRARAALSVPQQNTKVTPT